MEKPANGRGFKSQGDQPLAENENSLLQSGNGDEEDWLTHGKRAKEEEEEEEERRERQDDGEKEVKMRKGVVEEEEEEEEDYHGVPVDRGWAWVICAACFGMHVLVIGGAKSFGVLFVEIQEKYDVTSREMTFAQGIAFALIMGLSFLANILSVKFSSRAVIFSGGLLSGLGFILTAFVPSFNWIYLTYTTITGVGLSMSYSPCVVMVGCHFRKYRSMANGIAVSGAGVGSFILPSLIRVLLKWYGLPGCLLILGALMFHLCFFALLNRPLSSYIEAEERRRARATTAGMNISTTQHTFLENGDTNVDTNPDDLSVIPNLSYFSISQTSLFQRGHHYIKHRESGDFSKRRIATSKGDIMLASLQSIPQEQLEELADTCCSRIKTCVCCGKSELGDHKKRQPVLEWSILKNSVFLMYMFSCMMGHFAYPNVFFMIPPHVEMIGLSKNVAALILSIMGITDLVGRVFFGWFADRKIIPGRLGFVACMAISGGLNLVAPALTSFTTFVVYAALYGFFAGCYIALVAALLADTLGTERLGSSYALVMLAMSMSTLLGPPFCGALRDITLSWTAAFIFCGVAALVGSIFPLFVPCAERRERAKRERQTH